MSRIGKLAVAVPDGVKAALTGDVLTVEGPKGKLELAVHPAVELTLAKDGKAITVARREAAGVGPREARHHRAMWGTVRKLIANMVQGVAEGYTRQLQVVGVGYAARVEDATLVLRCGYANELKVPVPEGITIDTPEAGNLMVSGVGQMPCTTLTFHSADKQAVSQFAAAVRRLRPPEPYKGKGIRYMGEEVKRKAGKALAAGAT